MRKQLILLVLILVICAGTGFGAGIRDEMQSKETEQNFSAVMGKDWKLIAVYIDGKDSLFTRDKLTTEPFDGFFTVTFNSEFVSGTGAPNRYSAPYTLGGSQSISIMPMRSTQMALLFELEILNEYDFFSYLQNAYAWKMLKELNVVGGLEFYSKTKDGNEVRLVFSL